MAMNVVKIAELKDQLSRYLRSVEQGQEVVVTDRGRPIARIVPHESLIPRVRPIAPRRPFPGVRDRRRRPAAWPIGSTDLLAEERHEGRP
jgi:prevent-host-death family protein